MIERLRAWAPRRPLATDALFASALVLLEVVFLLLTPRELRPGQFPGALGWSVLCAVPVALRRVAPWPAVGVAVATLAVPALLRQAPATQGLAFVVLTYTMAAHRPLRPSALAALLLWVPVLLVNMVAPLRGVLDMGPGYLVLNNLLTASVAYAVGRAVHARRQSTQMLRERARIAEATQRSLAEQAVADERRRIARELHDVVAHHVSVMGVLATGARRVLRRDPDAADEAIATIEETSRATLRELRRLLDVLRTDAEPAAELAPQPGLTGIEALVEQVREAGLPVTLRVDGTPGPMEQGVALTVYRIVQEALTNALKHAGAATAVVRLTFTDAFLAVEVTDTGRGPGPRPDRIGHGLVGMRERVALYGGILRTGPRPGGGFRVYARIPVESARAVPA
ncbi:sensor histidine kinase [Micromonospora globispora]|uniref:histidine kinase n=1 Tax=Micromonospora globispora TaxID=1450148 RepID=A0A317JWC9_9ACTN|nr:sensor histidine kinase [Micromonospora globispora]PWU45077.1 sensor histidine kinase [Micromonospora globispora]PWU60295.1 sensor histidine kinase [Micromonospora globispora]RQW95871.1 sensor histidine kinase [Micromonospora globispora]